jgi:hypothetical protein
MPAAHQPTDNAARHVTGADESDLWFVQSTAYIVSGVLKTGAQYTRGVMAISPVAGAENISAHSNKGCALGNGFLQVVGHPH